MKVRKTYKRRYDHTLRVKLVTSTYIIYATNLVYRCCFLRTV